MWINKNNDFIVYDNTIKSKKLKKQHKKLFKEKISTDEWYNQVVCSLNLADSLVSDEQRYCLELYKDKLLTLCSNKKEILGYPEVQNIISECNDKFIDIFWKERDIVNSRAYRGVISKISA